MRWISLLGLCDHLFSRAILEGNSHLALLQAKCESHSGEVSSSVKHDLVVRNGVVWLSPFMCRLIQTQAQLIANGRPSAALWGESVNRAHSQHDRYRDTIPITPSDTCPLLSTSPPAATALSGAGSINVGRSRRRSPSEVQGQHVTMYL